MKTYIVYEHISPSGKVYVGQTCEINVRWEGKGNRYLNKNKEGRYIQPYFANALFKYGWDAFEHKIILEGISKSEANYAEKYLIKWYKSHKMSYNCTDGGEGTCGIKRTMSPEMRKHMSEIMLLHHPLKGTHRTERQKQMAREKMLGRKASDETRAKMSAAQSGMIRPWKHKEIFAFDKQTGEIVRKYASISKAAKELKLTPSGISNAARGKCPSMGGYIWCFTPNININDVKYKMMEDLKVYCYDKEGNLIDTFNNTKDAAAFVGGIINCISDNCSGRTKSYKGFIWRKSLKSKDEIINEYNSWRKKLCV